MDEIYIIGLAVSVIFTLIGILYRNSITRTTENTKEIKRVEDKVDSNDDKTDARLDEVEKDIVGIKTKIEK